jgi:hypothetical protein
VLAAAPCWAANGNINIFFDQAGALCQAAVPCGSPVRMYVYAMLQGASQSGITGAEYKVRVGANDNADGAYLFNETFDPSATVVGSGAFNPVDPTPRGVNVAWAACQLGDGTKVLIETVDVLNLDCQNTGELSLTVVKHDVTSNQFFQCPLFSLCDAPVYTKVCLGSNQTLCRNPEPPFPNNATCSTSGQAYINPGPSRHCTVGVAPTTWSGMKSLYSSN